MLVAMVCLSPQRMKTLPRRIRIAALLGFLFSWSIVALLLAGPVMLVWRSFTTPYAESPFTSFDFWFPLVGLLFPLITIGLLAVLLPSARMVGHLEAIRAAALSSNSAAAGTQVNALDQLRDQEPDISSMPASFQHLRRGGNSALVWTFLILAFTGIALPACVLIITGPDRFFSPATGFPVVIPLIFTIQLLVRSSRYFLPPLVTDGAGALTRAAYRFVSVDDGGIRWRGRGIARRDHAIPWHAATAFALLREVSKSDSRYTYVLFTPDDAFTWSVKLRPQSRAWDESTLLARIIIAQTKLPPRDLTALLDDQLGNQSSRPWAVQPKEAEQTLKTFPVSNKPPTAERKGAWAGVLASIDSSSQFVPSQYGGIRPRTYWINAALIAALLLTSLGGGALANRITDDYRTSYAAALLAQYQHIRPDAFDTMGADDDFHRWPVHEPATNDPSHYFYADGAYHITGGYSPWAWTSQAKVGDGAVQVTAVIHGRDEVYYNGVGLLLRQSSAPSEAEVDFSVDPYTGRWYLDSFYVSAPTTSDDDYHGGQIASGENSPAIKRGSGAANTLLIIMRGHEYYCYVNGVFLARGVDPDPNGPVYGHVGVYLADGKTEGTYANFAVYNTPPNPPPPSPFPFGIPFAA